MTYTPPATAGLAVDTNTSPSQLGRIASQGGQFSRVMPLMRKYEIAHLTPSSHISENLISAPAVPMFENAFGAIGRGAILQTATGPMAIEDLLPGDHVMTTHHGLQRLMWKGAMTLSPSDNRSMIRITADALGFGRPAMDLILGPAARILHTNPAIKMLTGATAALIPAQDFIDGSQFIALRPIGRVQVFQLGFERHSCVNVNGVPVETLHPGPTHLLNLQDGMRHHFEALFPHMQMPASFGDMVAPRLRLSDIELVNAA